MRSSGHVEISFDKPAKVFFAENGNKILEIYFFKNIFFLKITHWTRGLYS